MAEDQFLTLLEKRRPEIQDQLASWVTPARFFAMARQIEKQPLLRKCTADSLVECIMHAAQDGLEIGGTSGHCYVVPYGDQGVYQPGWRGLLFLKLKSGAITYSDTAVVFDFDRYEESRSTRGGTELIHVADQLQRFNLTKGKTEKDAREILQAHAYGAYALAKLSTGEYQYEFISADRIARHRSHSKQPDGLLWTKFWEEGWRKTPSRVLDKRLPTGPNAEAEDRHSRTLERDQYSVLAEEDDPPIAEEPESKKGDSAVTKPATQSPAPQPKADIRPINEEEIDLLDVARNDCGLKPSQTKKLLQEKFGVADFSGLKTDQIADVIKAMGQAAAA